MFHYKLEALRHPVLMGLDSASATKLGTCRESSSPVDLVSARAAIFKGRTHESLIVFAGCHCGCVFAA